MRRWSIEDAARSLTALNPHGHNRQIADYWLSLWRGNMPPVRASFDPQRVVQHLPAVALFQVRCDESVRCRIAGGHFRRVLGFELTGRDLLSVTPPLQRHERMRSVTALVLGAVGIGKRRIEYDDGSAEWVEEIMLPFADRAEDGSRRYLCHSNWRPVRGGARTPRSDAGLPSDRQFAALSQVPTAQSR